MSIIRLKDYQSQALDALRGYLRSASEQGRPDLAFYAATGCPYVEAPSLGRIPYVCLRIPTGGGKTVLAAHSLAIAADAYMRTDAPTALWLVPSQSIRDQTIRTLRDRTHANRRALADHYGGSVRILTIAEALRTSRADYDAGAVVIVATIQSLRVDETEGRKAYEPNGDLLDHFDGLAASDRGRLETNAEGRPVPSLVNALRLRRPLVLVDEAHNARTPLSFETLARLDPAAIVEFTATPVRPDRQSQLRGTHASNILHEASAAELKASEMIKLPVVLSGRPDPRDVLHDAISRLDGLARSARGEEERTGEFVRPIMLIQAEARSKERSTLHAEAVRDLLVRDFDVPEEQVAVATGEIRDLDRLDLMARDCAVRFVITQQALREGWDCPFAYVLCSLAEQRSARALEQLLGRVLRLPNARRKTDPDLNRAYAFAATNSFQETARTIQDGLVANGFERSEAVHLVQSAARFSETTSPQPVVEGLPMELDAEVLMAAVTRSGAPGVFVDPSRRTISLDASLWEPRSAELLRSVPGSSELLERIERRLGSPTRATFEGCLEIPRLAVRTAAGLEVFDRAHVLDGAWALETEDPSLVLRFLGDPGSRVEQARLDVARSGRLTVEFMDEGEQATLPLPASEWTAASVAAWIDRRLPSGLRRDVTRASSSAFVRRAVELACSSLGKEPQELARTRFGLLDAIVKAIAAHRSERERSAFAAALSSSSALDFVTSPEVALILSEDRYSYSRPYGGRVAFSKHVFPIVGDLEPEGEEHECAVYLDRSPLISGWIRNTSRQPNSFWLQTSTDRFYPDFVAFTMDHRVMAVEYKGRHLLTADDAREKEAVGRLWADRSGGRCMFRMVTIDELRSLDAAAAGAER